MPRVSRETASEAVTTDGLDVRIEHLEGGYSVCFESHTADADLADLFRGLPDDRCQLPRWGYVLRGKVGFRFSDREELYEAGDAYYVPPGHTPVHYAGSGDRRIQPHGRPRADDPGGDGEHACQRGDVMTTLLRPMTSRASTWGARERLLAGLPVSERRLWLAGALTAVLEGGDGPPVVLLHGGIECGGVVWGPVISRLAERHRVIVPDLPGLGQSDAVGRLDAVTFGDWFAELVRLTCSEPPALIAHSIGGSLAVRFAARRRELIRRLVVYAAPGIGPYRMPLGLRVVAIRFGLRPTERNAERFDRWAFFDFDRTRAQDPEWLEAFSAYTQARATVPHVKRTMRGLIGSGTKQVPDAELRRIAVPTELVWGRHDRFVPLELAEGASTRRGWPLRVIDDAGHVPHVERPDAFLGAIRAAVDATAGSR